MLSQEVSEVSKILGRHPEISRMLNSLMDLYIEKERIYLETQRDLSEINFTQGKIAAFRLIKKVLERRNDG